MELYCDSEQIALLELKIIQTAPYLNFNGHVYLYSV